MTGKTGQSFFELDPQLNAAASQGRIVDLFDIGDRAASVVVIAPVAPQGFLRGAHRDGSAFGEFLVKWWIHFSKQRHSDDALSLASRAGGRLLPDRDATDILGERAVAARSPRVDRP